MDHRSVLNTIRNEVIYFDSNDARIVAVDSLKDRSFFSLCRRIAWPLGRTVSAATATGLYIFTTTAPRFA